MIKREYTGVYITMVLFGAGVGLLIGSYAASILENRREDEEDYDDPEDSEETPMDGGERAPRELDRTSDENIERIIDDARQKQKEYQAAYEGLSDEEDDISTKVDFAVAQFLNHLLEDPRATPVHYQMVEQGLVTPDKMTEMLDAGEDEDVIDTPWSEYAMDQDSPVEDRYVFLTANPFRGEALTRIVHMVYYQEDELLVRIVDGRHVAVPDVFKAIPQDVVDSAIDALSWSDGKQPAFIHDIQEDKAFSITISKASLTPKVRKDEKPKHNPDEYGEA